MLDINNLIMCAMKAKNKVASETYKMLKAKILEFKTSAEQKEYNDVEEIGIIKKMIEERKKTAEIYVQNNRKELADKELSEVKVLEALLPETPTKEDVENYLNEYYPSGIEKRSMGIVIKEIKEALLGVDGKLVADCVKNILI